MAPQRIYLAGPEVFLANAKEVGEEKKKLCRKYGFEGVFPIDVEVKAEGRSPREVGLCISSVNEDLIKGCQVVIANLTPFRGPSADVGTVFEVGYAYALGKLVLAYSNAVESFTDRTVKALGGKVTRGSDGLLRDGLGMFVEENGFVDNLMIDGCIAANSGVLVVERAPAGELFSHLGGFEKCLQAAKAKLI
jgi:nucleoside 2-deoxyribosyltransferase